ncbi:MAG: cation diffusion facilitator family transporter [Candidatus Humimicrobiaceae bacterium]
MNNKKFMARISKRKIATISLFISIFLVTVKALVAYFSNSLGVFSEALNNGLDLVTVLITFFAVRMAARPADRDHTYGHGKYENFSGLIEVIIISGLCLFIIYRSIQRLIYRDFSLNINWVVFTILGVSVLLNIFRVVFIGALIKKENSYAFRAEFINYSGDIVASIIVIAGLVFAEFGIYIADPIASIIVALVVIGLSIKLSVGIARNLLDYVPKEITDRILKIVEGISEIRDINDIRVHEVGGLKFINLDVTIPHNFYLAQVEKIKGKIKQNIKKEFKDSKIIIEVKPHLSPENLEDYIKAILMAEENIGEIHNIYIYNVGNKIDASVHVNLKHFLKLKEIEKLTKETENKLKEKIDNLRRIYIHVEDLSGQENWDDVTSNSEGLIKKVKERIPAEIDSSSCHNFSILRKGNIYHVAFHCRLDKDMLIRDAHRIISETEDKIKAEIKRIGEILIHVEPG